MKGIDAYDADQRDTDNDGIGNICDADLDDDCSVNFLDLGSMKNGFFLPPGPSGVPSNCDGSRPRH